jgi:hypothetical protein
MLSGERLSGRFEAEGALNAHTLVFRGPDGGLHTLGRDFESDYVAEHVVCSKGEPARADVRTIDMSDRLLADITVLFDTCAEHYLFGEVTTADRFSLPARGTLFSPVTGSGSTIRFNYATWADIRRFGLGYVLVSRGVLTVRSVMRGGAPGRPAQDRSEDVSVLTLTVAASESVEYVKRIGDAVRRDEIVARKLPVEPFAQQIRLAGEQMRVIENRSGARAADIARQRAIADEAARIDSGEYRTDLALSKEGYLPAELLDIGRLKCRKDARTILRLDEAARELKARTSHELRKLEVLRARLAARRDAWERGAAVRAPADGILADIRRVRRADKAVLTFVVRRPP